MIPKRPLTRQQSRLGLPRSFQVEVSLGQPCQSDETSQHPDWNGIPKSPLTNFS